MHTRFRSIGSISRLIASVLTIALVMLGGQEAQAASRSVPSTPVAHSNTTQALGKVPTAELAKHLTRSWTVAIAPGSTVRVGGITMTTSRTARPGYVAGTTCTINIYGPYVDEPTYPANVVVAAAVQCTYPVSGLSISAYVFSYNPTTGSYYLLNDNSYVNDNNPVIATVQTSYPISANGYYFGATNGYVGDPIDQYFSAVQNQATYVYPA